MNVCNATDNDLSSECRLNSFIKNRHFAPTMRAGEFLVILSVFAVLFLHTEAKKKRGWNNQRRLKRLCAKQSNSTQNNSALEMHAFFDLKPKKNAFACLKITTCKSEPVCFVASYPNQNGSAVNESTKWWRLLSYIQEDRKIEPISLTGWNGGKHKGLSHYIQNQPNIYRMCLDATVFRFVHISEGKNNNHVKRAVNSSSSKSPSSTSNKPVKTTSGGIDPVSLCPIFSKEDSKNIIPIRYLFCQGSDCPCMRICVGQGRNRTNFHDCSTFRIICTFDCTDSNQKQIQTPLPTTIKPKRRAKSTSSQRKHRPSRKRKQRGRKRKKSGKGKKKRPRRKPKSKRGKRNGRKQNKKTQSNKKKG